MKIRLSDLAEEDLISAFAFYESKVQGLGNYLLETISQELGKLAYLRGIHEMVGPYHRMISKKFQLSVYYSIQENQILVHAIIDSRRSPDWTAWRLGLNDSN